MLRTASSRFAASSSRVNSSTNSLASVTTSAARIVVGSTVSTTNAVAARHISGVSPSTSQLPALARQRSAAKQSASISTATMRSSRNSKNNNNNNLAFLPVSVSAVLSQTAQGLLSKQQREVSSKVESTTKDLFRNIYFSKESMDAANTEGPQYVEVTNDELRLEFLDASKDYQQTAALMFGNDDELRRGDVPSCFIPRSVENNISHGAGATIVLDKHQVLDFFRSQSSSAHL